MTGEKPEVFVKRLIEEIKKAHLGLGKKEIEMTAEDWVKFEQAEFCWLCEKEFEEEGKKIKVRDHCHFTGKFRGVAHADCNLRFKKPKFTPVFFHNLEHYDSHLFVKSLGVVDEVLSIDCSPNNDEKYISFSIRFELEKVWERNEDGKMQERTIVHEIRFVDSFKFMGTSLERLVGNLQKDQFVEMKKFFGEKSDLLIRKGVFPYEWFDSMEKRKCEKLPERSKFFSELNDEETSIDDFLHVHRVWREFGLKNMKEYHDLYLTTDILLLADVFENFRKICQTHYELDPAHFFTAPGLAWEAMLKFSEVRLELLHDVDMLQMVERGMRGGNVNAFCRFSQANNKFMENFDEKKPSKFIVYLDANNLYGWAMSKPLPVGKFRWMAKDEILNWEEIVKKEGEGCILEVDLIYPKELHVHHIDFPLCPGTLETGWS